MTSAAIPAEPNGIARLEAAFVGARNAGRGALIPYLCVGDPDLATSAAIVRALADAGCDAIELGVPYGDPLADGPTIAAASTRALAAGTRIDDVLELAAAAAGGPPIILFTYYNPVLQYGVERFADGLLAAGACGAIVPDVPLEESDPLASAFGARGLALPQLIAPTTPVGRAIVIAAHSTGFTYLVSRLGVTSAAREPDLAWIATRVDTLRGIGGPPLAVGFGIARADHVRKVCAIADGAIVGSALIDAYAGTRGDEAAARVRAFIAPLVTAARR